MGWEKQSCYFPNPQTAQVSVEVFGVHLGPEERYLCSEVRLGPEEMFIERSARRWDELEAKMKADKD